MACRLCCVSWFCPGRPVGREFVLRCVGNGAEPQVGPGLVGAGKGVVFVSSLLVTNYM